MVHGGPWVIAGRYRLESKLGAGGMAEVWLAADLRLNGKYVAVKRLPALAAASDVDLERARREAYAVAALDHPNVVSVTDFIVEQGQPFIVMEFVPGATLHQLCTPHGLPGDQAARILGQVAAALADAHRAGIVHRDIKPSNVLVSERGDAKLADFGIARSADGPRLTEQGAFTGTVGYLAPEIFDDVPPSAASDVWALGVTLFEALEGHAAYEGDSTPTLIYRIVNTPPPRPVRAAGFAPMLERMLARDPRHRPDAASIATELLAGRATPAAAAPPAAAGVPPAPPPSPGPMPVWGPQPGRPAAKRAGSPTPDDTVVRSALAPQRATPPRKRRTRGWILVAVPVVVLGSAVGIVISQAGGGNTPSADQGLPGISAPASSTGAQSSAAQSSAAATSSQPRVGGAPPPASSTGAGVPSCAAGEPADIAVQQLVTALQRTPAGFPPDATDRATIDRCTVRAARPSARRLYGHFFGSPGADTTGGDGTGRVAMFDVPAGGSAVLHVTMTRQPDGGYAATSLRLAG